MKKLKQITALVGAVLLVGMYVLTLILSLSNDPNAGNMLMASIYCTVLVPVFLYACTLVFRLKRPGEEPPAAASKAPPVDTLIFDLGNVLVRYDWRTFLKEQGYDKEAIRAIGDAVFLSKDWVDADRGIKSEEEILQAFIENDTEYEKEIRDVFEHMGGVIKTYAYTRSWLMHLKKCGFKIYYLSNFSEPLYKKCEKEMDFLDLMDGGYMSWQLKMLKPEPEFYQKLLADFKINPERAVFLDDMLDNVAEARAQGIHAVHFKDRKEVLKELAEEYRVV